MDHTMAVLSFDAEARYRLLCEKLTNHTSSVWRSSTQQVVAGNEILLHAA